MPRLALTIGVALAVVGCGSRESPPPASVAASPVVPAETATAPTLRGWLASHPPDTVPSWEEPQGAPDRIEDSLLRVHGFTLNMSYAEIVAIGGAPQSEATDTSDLDGLIVRTLRYPFGELTLYGDDLQYVECTGPGCSTPAGITLGSSRSQVVAAYGRGHHGYDPSKDLLMYAGVRSDCGLTLHFTADSVSAISLWCDNS